LPCSVHLLCQNAALRGGARPGQAAQGDLPPALQPQPQAPAPPGHEGDENARAQLVEENTGLIWCVVKRFYGRGTEAEDLFQIGSIGLLKAIDKFDLGYDDAGWDVEFRQE